MVKRERKTDADSVNVIRILNEPLTRQCLILVQIMSGSDIDKATIHLQFFKYVLRDSHTMLKMNPFLITPAGLGFPKMPSWVKKRFPDGFPAEELIKLQGRIQDFKKQPFFELAAKQAGKSVKRFLTGLPTKYIAPQKVADEFCNCPIPKGTSRFYFSKDFGSPDPFDLLGITVRDKADNIKTKGWFYSYPHGNLST